MAKYFLSSILLILISQSVYSFDFQPLSSDFSIGSPTAVTFCINDTFFDSFIPTGCKITNGAVNGSDTSGPTYNFPDGTPAVFPDSPIAPLVELTLEDSAINDIYMDGSLIGATPGNSFFVGTLTDYVFRDTRDNNLVFGVRIELETMVDGGFNELQIDDIFRSGFTGFSAAIGYSRASNNDMRLVRGARTSTDSLFGGSVIYDPDVVRLYAGINAVELNPSTGFYFIKTDAESYTTTDDAIRITQLGEEAQPYAEQTFSGFTPTVVPVPASLWLLISACSGMYWMGRKKKN